MKRKGTNLKALSLSQSSTKSASKMTSQTKGILKPSQERRNKRHHKKTATFDDKNIAQTFHPLNKDYGHDKITEPLTPYNRSPGEYDRYSTPIDAVVLAQKLTNLISTPQSSNRQNGETDFKKRLKDHYKNKASKKG